MAKVLVNEEEYQALKRAARPRPPSPRPTLEEVPEKMQDVNKEVIARQENEEMRKVAGEEEPRKEEQREEGEGGEESFDDDEKLDDYLSFVPKRNRSRARDYMRCMISSPAVEVRNGIVYVRGKKAGHFFPILQHFFGKAGRSPPREAEFLSAFLPSGRKKREKKKKKSPPVAKKKKMELDERIASLLD